MLLKVFSSGVILLLICLFSNVIGDCPPLELIEPCQCKTPRDPTIVCSNITKPETINDLITRSGKLRFKHFTLENSTLSFLPARTLISKQFTSLVIINTTLTDLFDEVPSSNNRIDWFALVNVRIQRTVQWSLFQKLTKLRLLQLTNIPIKKLGKDFISNINPGLSDFFLSESKTTSLADGVFDSMKNLVQVLITNNEIKTLKRNMFSRPAAVVVLSFQDNRIETLPDDMFTDFPELTLLTLTGNKIVFLEEAVFARVFEQLNRFNVEGNPIKCDCSLAWIGRFDPFSVKGECDGPKIIKGTQIRSLTEKDFRYCI